MVTARALRCGSVPSIISFPRRSGPRLAFQRPQPRCSVLRTGAAAVADASTIQGLPEFLQNLKYDDKGLVTVIVQVSRRHCGVVSTVLMGARSQAAAIIYETGGRGAVHDIDEVVCV